MYSVIFVFANLTNNMLDISFLQKDAQAGRRRGNNFSKFPDGTSLELFKDRRKPGKERSSGRYF